MLLNSRTTRLLLESADELGIPRSSVLDPLGIVEADVVDPKRKIEWMTVVMICDQLSRIFDGDADRLREVGRRMHNLPAYAPLRRLARSVVSVRTLYEIANGWVAPANFPHLRLLSQFVSRRRMVLHGEIPASYAPSAAFMRIFEGSATELPRLLDLPPAVMIESRVTPRTCDFVIDLPQTPKRAPGSGCRPDSHLIYGDRDDRRYPCRALPAANIQPFRPSAFQPFSSPCPPPASPA